MINRPELVTDEKQWPSIIRNENLLKFSIKYKLLPVLTTNYALVKKQCKFV